MAALNPSHSRFALLSAIMLCACAALAEQTSQIAHLLTTNRPGRHYLEPAWVGESKVTVQTGFFATRTNTLTQDSSESELRFDFFHYIQKPSALPLGSRAVSQFSDRGAEGGRHTRLHIHRETLPTDSQLTNVPTVAALTNLLGLSWGPKSAWGDSQAMHSQASWAYFRMKDDLTLETLSVFCLTTVTNGQSEEFVESIRIRRGTARPSR